MVEGTIAKWNKSPGENVKQGEILAEIETEKLNYDLEATGSGAFHPIATEGSNVPVDGVMGYLLADGESPPAAESQADATATEAASDTRTRRIAPPSRSVAGEVPSTPGARRLAAKLEVNLAEVTPTGPRGRVVENDVRSYAEYRGTSEEPSLPAGAPEPSKTTPLEGMRKAIAQHMKGSISNTAQLSFFLEVDVTEAQRLRRDASGSDGVNLTMANVLMKVCAETLKRHPEHNTILSDGNVHYFDDINIGMAVSLRDGLIVPVVNQVDKKSLSDISRESQELVEKAKDGKLLPDDLAGGTFTISVLGSVDGFTPILNAGQTAIMGVGRSADKPVVKNGEVVVREMMTVSLTVDHQVVDGASVAGFLRRFQQIIERPATLFK